MNKTVEFVTKTLCIGFVRTSIKAFFAKSGVAQSGKPWPIGKWTGNGKSCRKYTLNIKIKKSITKVARLVKLG